MLFPVKRDLWVRALGTSDVEYLFNTIGADFFVNSSQGEQTLVNIIYYLKNQLPQDRIKNTVEFEIVLGEPEGGSYG